MQFVCNLVLLTKLKRDKFLVVIVVKYHILLIAKTIGKSLSFFFLSVSQTNSNALKEHEVPNEEASNLVI